jgi:GxxExxY protein
MAERWLGNEMPVSVETPLKQLSQAEFAEVSYGIMAEIFALHGELGHLFDEKVYQHALKSRTGDLQTEVEISVSFRDFSKSYFMDAIASSGAVFELKTVDALHQRHRSQLLNYLLLAELQHGKLVNLRPEKVEHEFVNTSLTHADRTRFETRETMWQPSTGFGSHEKSSILELLYDWGTGLERSLYEDGLIHLFGGDDKVVCDVDVILGGKYVSNQSTLLCAPRTAFKVTIFERNAHTYKNNLSQFLSSTSLEAIQWINIALRHITFETII